MCSNLIDVCDRFSFDLHQDFSTILTMASKVLTIDTEASKQAYYAAATSITAQEVIHISGQPGTNANCSVPSDYEAQIQLALLNLRKIMLIAGCSVPDIVSVRFYIVNYDPNRRLHTRHIQKFLGTHRPAMTLVPVPSLAGKGWLFEIEAVVAKTAAAKRIQIPTSLSLPLEEVDVVVVGAGLAGLTAATDIINAGLSCVVLEARNRVGGRTWTTPLKDGGVTDLGAAWINDTNQSKMISLARKFGLELIEQNTNGNCVLQTEEGAIEHFPYGELPPVSESESRHANDMPLTKPSSSKRASRPMWPSSGINQKPTASKWTAHILVI